MNEKLTADNLKTLKVGDKVKCIKWDGFNFTPGEIYEVSSVDMGHSSVSFKGAVGALIPWLLGQDDIEFEIVSSASSESRPKMASRPHADVIHAWADGAEVEWRGDDCEAWMDIDNPSFNPNSQYRIKEPKKSLWLLKSKHGANYSTTPLPVTLEKAEETFGSGWNIIKAIDVPEES